MQQGVQSGKRGRNGVCGARCMSCCQSSSSILVCLRSIVAASGQKKGGQQKERAIQNQSIIPDPGLTDDLYYSSMMPLCHCLFYQAEWPRTAGASARLCICSAMSYSRSRQCYLMRGGGQHAHLLPSGGDVSPSSVCLVLFDANSSKSDATPRSTFLPSVRLQQRPLV